MHDLSLQLFMKKKYGIKFRSQPALDVCPKICISDEGKIDRSGHLQSFAGSPAIPFLCKCHALLPDQIGYRLMFLLHKKCLRIK